MKPFSFRGYRNMAPLGPMGHIVIATSFCGERSPAFRAKTTTLGTYQEDFVCGGKGIGGGANGTEQDGDSGIPNAGHSRGLRLDEDGSRRHLWDGC
jgi:hypothetical protein